MHIVILWWSGRMWKAVINQALSYKRNVTALTRRKWSLASLVVWSNWLLTEVVWDATNSQDISNIIHNIDAIVHTVSVPLFHTKPTNIYSNTTKAVIKLLQTNKDVHYIVMSSTGTDDKRKSLPRGISHIYEYLIWDVANDKEYEEELLAQSDTKWTIIKSPFLTKWLAQNTKLIQFESYIFSIFDIISRNTIAKVIIDTIIQKNHILQKIVPLIK